MSEVMKWDLEDIAKMNAILDMRAANEAASNQLQDEKMKDMQDSRSR